MNLENKTIVILLAEGYHEHEFWFPYYRFLEEGAQVLPTGLQKGIVRGEGNFGKDGLPAEVRHTIDEVMDAEPHCVFLPGGIYNNLILRENKPVLDFVRRSVLRGTIVAAICHGQWLLASAGVLRGRTVSASKDMADDVINAGATFVGGCVQDGNLITAEYYPYLPQQFRILIPAIANGVMRGPG